VHLKKASRFVFSATPNTHSDGQAALQSSGGVCTTANNDGRQTSDPQRKHLINTMYSNASNVPPLEYALLASILLSQ
ncbi:hypothetical protein Tco_1388547, partial [Tanacetum coccineum]